MTATEALVTTIFDSDERAAVAATAELLRRAGLPLVSVAGPVVALPSKFTIVNEPIPIEFLPMLTRDVRAGEYYTPDQVAAMLQSLTVTARPLTARDVVTGLASWGKGPGDPTESVVAGSAVRALAAERHQLLIPAEIPSAATERAMQKDPGSLTAAQRQLLLDPTRIRGLDMLQVLLLLAHATGKVVRGATATAAPTTAADGASGLRRAGPLSHPCQALAPSTGAKKVAEAGTNAILRKKLVLDFGKNLGSEEAAKLKNNFRGYKVATGVVSTYILLAGATLTMTSDKSTTHFRHQMYDESRNVTFTAQAMFSSPVAQRHLGCWGFAGVTVPPTGPLQGYTVRWELRQELQMLRAEEGADAKKLLQGGDRTDGTGTSTLTTMPRREVQPPEPGSDVPTHTGYTTVVAHLTKTDFPLKLSDLFGLAADSEAAPYMATLTMALRFIKDAGLPNAVMQFPVTYHASDAFTINGEATLWMPGMGTGTWSADLYSCDGPTGPWKGSVSINGSASAALEEAARIAGYHGPASGPPTVAHPRFRLDPKDDGDQLVPLGGTNAWRLVIDLDPTAVSQALNPSTAQQLGAMVNGVPTVVGTGSWSAAKTDLRTIARLYGDRLMSGSTLYVQFSPGDARCKGGSSVLADVFDPS